MRTIPLEEFIHTSLVLVTFRWQIWLMFCMASALLSDFASSRTEPSFLLTQEKSDVREFLSSVQIWRLLGALPVLSVSSKLRTWNLVHVSLRGPTRLFMVGCVYGHFVFLRILGRFFVGLDDWVDAPVLATAGLDDCVGALAG